jgi:peptidoglycan/LPS O-acetylase OafA/YrhL
MKSKNIQYLPAIDHLRAFACLWIVIYHGLHLISYDIRFHQPFQSTNWLPSNSLLLSTLVEGHSAVALFMVLSGFIFTYGIRGRDIFYLAFLKNRLLRTYPLFILLIFLGISFYPNNFSFAAFIQTILGFGNLKGSLNLGNYSAMFWAIAVEWQFYFIFPLLLLLSKSNTKLFVGIIGLLIAFRALAFFDNLNIRYISYSTIVGRLDQFIFGMIAAQIYLKFSTKNLFGGLLFPIVAFIAIWNLHWLNQHGGWPGQQWFRVIMPTAEGLIWSALILAYIDFSKYIPSILSTILAKVGELSYSVYLIHFIVVKTIVSHQLYWHFTDSAVENALLNTFLIVIPIVIVLSLITFNLIEKPFLNLRVNYIKPSTP